MNEIKKLTDRIVKFRDARDWKQFHNPKDLALSLVLESAEVMEHFQWKSKEEMQKYIKTSKEDIAEELADVMYWVLLMSKDLDINIHEALLDKVEKNEAKYPVHKAKGSHKKYTEL
ncbi:nucleotide pyrophosphohydrolase [Patescibacteria group bacterium]